MKAKMSMGRLLAGLILGILVSVATFLQGQTISLRISPNTINFPAEDPDLTPLIPADNPILVEITIGSSRPWQLTLRAQGDLRAGGGRIISIQNVSWTSMASPPFISGTLVSQVAQLGASGQGPVQTSGELNFRFQNSWSYRPGNYNQSVTITLSVL